MGGASRQLVVIGGGPGGYAAAFQAADRGLEVTLVDPEENPGGVCLYRGCIPSKALLHVARVMHDAGEASSWGVRFSEPEVDLDRLRAWKGDVVAKLTGGLGQLAKQRRVEHLQGIARFRDRRSLTVHTAENGQQEVRFEQAIIATGSEPIPLPHAPEDERVWDSARALELPEVPQSLLVVGGGYIGLELGTVYAALGTRVTVVEMTAGLLPGVDRDLVSPLKRGLTERFEEVLLETKVSALKARKDGVMATLEDKDGQSRRRRFDRVLVAIGRRPQRGDLGLDHTDVELTDQGFAKVDRERRTTDDRIFAIGDVAGEPMLAHKATHEGRAAALVIAGERAHYDPRCVPAVVFTDPEIAWTGLTETEARRRGRDIRVARLPWAASGRAATLGRSDGLTKVIMDPETKRLLGVGVVGPGAGELIAEAVLAIEMAAVADDVRWSIHPHPTLSETIMEATDLLYGESTHYHTPRRKRGGGTST